MHIRSRLWGMWAIGVAVPVAVTAVVVTAGLDSDPGTDTVSQATVGEVGPRFAHATRVRVDALESALARLAGDQTLRVTEASMRPHDWDERVALTGMRPAPAWVRAFNLTNPKAHAPTDRRSWRHLATESPGGWKRLVAGRDSLEVGALVDGDAAAIVVARFAVRDIAEQAMDDIGRAGQIAYFVADPERRRFVHHSRSGFDGRRILDLYPELDAARAVESREVFATTPAWDGPNHHVWMSAWPELGMLLGVARSENISVSSWMWTQRGLILVLVAAAIFSAIVVGRSSSYLVGAFHGLSHSVDRYTAGDLAHRLELFGEDEISDLGRELNVMAEHWDRRQLAELIAARYDTLRRVRHLVEEETSDVRSGIETLGRNLDSTDPSPILVRGVGRVLNRLADQLRDVEGRVGADVDASEPRLDPVPLERFLERTVRDSGALTDGKLVIATHVEPGLETLAAVEPAIQRTLLQLVENARQAMPRGGELRLEARLENQDVHLDVIDTGVGMTPHFLQHHLFRPFAGEWESGEGLGLSLVEAREAIRRLGGDLEVASREGVGTRVSVVCPIDTFEEAPELAQSRIG